MPNGYHGHILEMDLSLRRGEVTASPGIWHRTYSSGNGTVLYDLLKETYPFLDPLSQENQLILACSMHYKRLVSYPVPYRVDPRFGGPAMSPINDTSHLVEPGDTLKDIFPLTMNC